MYKVAIIGGSDPSIQELVHQAQALYPGKIEFLVFDNKENIGSESDWTFYGYDTIMEAADAGTAMAYDGKVDILLKGIITTHDLLKAILNKNHSLKERDLLSHVALLQLADLNRPLLLTDAAMNISPNEEELVKIIENAEEIAKKIGIMCPKIALLSSAENFNSKMPSSVLARNVTQQLSHASEAIVYGPLSLDLAVSKMAVEKKRFQAPIMGDADILVVPTIDVANVLYKSLLLFSKVRIGGCLVGTKVPVVITSRSDLLENKLFSLKFAIDQLNY